jgi:hypothetical protein
VWMTNALHRPTTYITADFPESLFYADVYLRTTLPDIDVVYLHEGERIANSVHPRIILCPIHNVDAALSAPDLIVNTGSMQEMSDDYVAFYMEKIDRSAAQRFYSFNNFAQPIMDRLETMNFAAPTMSGQWAAEVRRFHPGQRSRAEIFFVRAGESPSASDLAQAAVDGPDPADGAAFLDLFDAVRRARRGELLIEAAAKAMLGMHSIPKEALWMARAAVPKSASGRAILKYLEDMATTADVYAIQDRSVEGAVSGDVLRIGSDRWPIIGTNGGSIETFMELEDAAEIAGWAGDLRSNQPAQAIIATVDDKVVAKTVPIGARPDIEAGYGSCVRPAQFTIKVPLPRTKAIPTVRVFAITADQKAAEVTSGTGAPNSFRFL